MIITSSRIKARSGHRAVANHVLRGKDNEKVILLRGGEHQLADAVEDAREWKRQYAIRHFSISPQEPMTRKQLREVLDDLSAEFGFDPATATVVEHQKQRADGQAHDRHWHILVPEVDALTGRCMSSSHTYARQEKLARVAEIRLGHTVTPGRHNRAVVNALRQEGRLEIAEKLEQAGITKSDLPNSSFTASQHQEGKRKGLDLPALKQAVSAAWERSDGRKALEAALQEQGLRIGRGEKKDTWILTDEEGRFLGALHRLAGVRKGQVSQRMQEVPAHEDRSTATPKWQPAARFEPADLYRSQEGPRDGIGNPGPPRNAPRVRARRSNRAADGHLGEDRAEADADRTEAGDRRRRMIAAAQLRAAFQRHQLDLEEEIRARARARIRPEPPARPRKRTPAAGGGGNPWLGKGIQNERQARGVSWRWEHQGFQTQVTDRFVMVKGADWRLVDYGNRCVIDEVTDDSVRALITKARRDWNGGIRCHGSQHFLEQAWLEAQRQGVDFSVRDDPDWRPPEHIQMQWQLECDEAEYEQEVVDRPEVDYTRKNDSEAVQFRM